MSDFNKVDADLPPTRNKEYHTHRWSLWEGGKWVRDEELDAYINTWAGKGYVLDSITALESSGITVLLVFVKN